MSLRCRFACLGIALALGVAVPCAQAGISEARAGFAQFQAEFKAALDAQARNDLKSFSQHQDKAQECLKQARKLFDEAGAKASNDPEVLRDYAGVLLRMGDVDLAAEVLDRVARQAPEDAGVWRELGRALAAAGKARSGAAIRALRRSLHIDAASPGAAETYALLGQVYRRRGLYDLARESCTKALATHPDSVPAKLGIVAAKIEEGHMREASDALDALGALPPEYAAQVPSLLTEAVDRFGETRRWFPDTPEDHLAYAKVLIRVGRLTQSLAAAERAAALSPDVYSTWNLIGDLSRQLNNPQKARDAYQHSLQLKPDQPRTTEYLRDVEKEISRNQGKAAETGK